MVTQSVIMVQAVLEKGSPVRDLQHLQMQRIFPSHPLLEVSIQKQSPLLPLEKNTRSTFLKINPGQTARANSYITLLAARTCTL